MLIRLSDMLMMCLYRDKGKCLQCLCCEFISKAMYHIILILLSQIRLWYLCYSALLAVCLSDLYSHSLGVHYYSLVLGNIFISVSLFQIAYFVLLLLRSLGYNYNRMTSKE